MDYLECFGVAKKIYKWRDVNGLTREKGKSDYKKNTPHVNIRVITTLGTGLKNRDTWSAIFESMKGKIIVWSLKTCLQNVGLSC